VSRGCTLAGTVDSKFRYTIALISVEHFTKNALNHSRFDFVTIQLYSSPLRPHSIEQTLLICGFYFYRLNSNASVCRDQHCACADRAHSGNSWTVSLVSIELNEPTAIQISRRNLYMNLNIWNCHGAQSELLHNT
jgi:hypothetical protein